MEEHHQHENQTLKQNTDEVNELQQLEEDVKSMAQRISECRETLPIQLTNTLNSIISAQRPAISTRSDNNSDPGPSDARIPFDSKGRVEILVENDHMNIESVQLIKQKISWNASAERLLVKRMKDILSRIDKLDSFNQDMIHPAFTKKTRT